MSAWQFSFLLLPQLNRTQTYILLHWVNYSFFFLLCSGIMERISAPLCTALFEQRIQSGSSTNTSPFSTKDTSKFPQEDHELSSTDLYTIHIISICWIINSQHKFLSTLRYEHWDSYSPGCSKLFYTNPAASTFILGDIYSSLLFVNIINGSIK